MSSTLIIIQLRISDASVIESWGMKSHYCGRGSRGAGKIARNAAGSTNLADPSLKTAEEWLGIGLFRNPNGQMVEFHDWTTDPGIGMIHQGVESRMAECVIQRRGDS